MIALLEFGRAAAEHRERRMDVLGSRARIDRDPLRMLLGEAEGIVPHLGNCLGSADTPVTSGWTKGYDVGIDHKQYAWPARPRLPRCSRAKVIEVAFERETKVAVVGRCLGIASTERTHCREIRATGACLLPRNRRIVSRHQCSLAEIEVRQASVQPRAWV